MLENDTLRGGVAHALNHGSVVHLVRENNAPREFGTEGGERCIICDVTGREYQSTVLAVESSELILQGKMHGSVPSNVARATSTMAVGVQSAAADGNQSINSSTRNSRREATYCMVSSTTGLFPIPK